MKYFVNFVDGKVNCSWERSADNVIHPSYIPDGDIVEVTPDQYENTRYLVLKDGVVELNGKYLKMKRRKRLDKLKKREEKKRAKADWQAIRSELSDVDEIADVDEILTNIDDEV